MYNPLAQLKEECQLLFEEAASKAYPGVELPRSKYSQPPSPDMGELSLALCFQLARVIRSRPTKIAEDIARHMDTDSSILIESVAAVNGYINFHANIDSFAKLVLETVVDQDYEYGFLKAVKPEKVMVEHTSANPNGPIHIGNARNSILGACLAEMLKRRGHDVVVHFLVNDMGRQVAMATYGWELIGKPEPEGRAELWVGTIYASVNVINEMKTLRADLREAEEKGLTGKVTECKHKLEEYETAARELRKRNEFLFDALSEKLDQIADPSGEIVRLNSEYEKGDPATKETVRNVVNYCLRGFEDSLGEIGISFDSFDYESDLVWRKAAEEVLGSLKETPYVFKDEGALILDCDSIAVNYDLKARWGLNPKHEVPRLVLVRSDGTTLYTLRDIAYSIWKFGLVDRVINVIGYEQTLAQLQLRIALAALGHIEMGDKQTHYAYEFVKLPGVKMSGRLGRYVTLNEVIDRSTELAFEEVSKRNPDLPQEEKDRTARTVGHGAVKYTLLSVDPMKAVIFDWGKALNFETNSAPFIQYSHARACNILKRANERPKPEYGRLVDPRERELITLLASFPQVFQDAVIELKPSDISAYVNTLADSFNSFYAALPVLKAEPSGLLGARLMLVEAVRLVLRNALSLLGIIAPERM
jgi:arginyl-tRNA synthetase